MREIHDLYIHGDLIKYFERYPKERDWWKKEFVREFLEKELPYERIEWLWSIIQCQLNYHPDNEFGGSMTDDEAKSVLGFLTPFIKKYKELEGEE